MSRALVCHGFGDPPILSVDPLPSPELRAGSVLMGVRAASLNFTDVLMMKGRYQERPVPPFVPCMDGAGVVTAVGAGVTRFRVGDRVLASGVPGMASEQVVLPEERIIPVPADVDLVSAAASINSHLTAYHGLVDRAQLKAGETLLVLGANGAVGKAAVEIGRFLGARVLAVVRNRSRAEEVLGAGADSVIVLDEGDLRTQLAAVIGRSAVDVVVDPVGGTLFEQALRCLRWRGRILTVGFAGGEIPKVSMNLPLLKGCSILGVYCGGLMIEQFDVFVKQIQEVLRLLGERKVSPVVGEVYQLDEFEAAWSMFHDETHRSKVVFAPTNRQ